MTDDIVTRLRERIPYAIHPHVLAEAKLLSDAVKEIEHLRKERDRWAEFAIHIATCPNWGRRTCWDCVSPTNQDQARQAGLEDVIRSEYGKR